MTDLSGGGSKTPKVYDLPFIIPMDSTMYEDLLNVDRKTKESLRARHRLFIDQNFEANTIASIMVESLLLALHSHICSNGISILKDETTNGINFYDLLEITASNKVDKSAEKQGNINVVFRTGSCVDALVSDDIHLEDKKDAESQYIAIDAAYTYPGDENATKAMLEIDRIARKSLSDRYNILLDKPFMAVATGYLFLENLYVYLVQKLVLKNKSSAMINFNDIIEFHAIRKGDKVEFHLRPGMDAKLIIKSDAVTESEDEED